MKRLWMMIGVLFLVLVFGRVTPQHAQNAQNAATGGEKVDEDHLLLVGMMRTINTAEVMELSKYGAYASWQTLLSHQSDFLNQWLARFHARQGNGHFGEAPEILPGWNLRLEVQSGGKGYLALLEDTSDKGGFAAVSDERGVIRECRYIH